MKEKTNKNKAPGELKKASTLFVIDAIILLVISLLIFHLDQNINQPKSIKVLAVGEDKNLTPTTGTVAEIQLLAKPGSGKIYVETAPLTSIDLQASIINSNKLACEFLERDCSKYDFYYKIDSGSYFISGPSAGMAISVLTVAYLENLDINPNVAITGTINSGYLIGPVSGLKEKVTAGINTGVDTILIPYGQSEYTEKTGKVTKTIDLKNITDELNINLIEVTDIYDALYYFTNKSYEKTNENFVVNQEYLDIMKEISQNLCSRTQELITFVEQNNLNETVYNKSLEFYKNAKEARSQELYYSAASFCFSANPLLFETKLKYLKETQGLNLDEVYINTTKRIIELENTINKEFNTLGDIQTKGTVNERIEEAKSKLQQYSENRSDVSSLAFAHERVYSAEEWKRFFGVDTKTINLDNEYLKQTCTLKIYELNSMKELLRMYLSSDLADSINLETSLKYLSQGKYDLCLYETLIEKSSLNVLTTYLFISEEILNQTVENKLDAAFKEINKQTQKGYFPIIAYCYLEYATLLYSQGDVISAMYFAEDAIELSKMSLFIPKKEIHFDYIGITNFLLGFCFGLIIKDILLLLSSSRKINTISRQSEEQRLSKQHKHHNQSTGKEISNKGNSKAKSKPHKPKHQNQRFN